MSFKAAADELLVSQSAISRQVRELEERTGKPLFERHHRSVTLTAEGQRLLDTVTAAFDAITQTFVEISEPQQSRNVFVSAEAAFSANWLGPRLPEFNRLHPDIDIFLDSDNQLVDMRSHPADLAIRYGRNEDTWSDGHKRHLANVIMIPVISPALLKKVSPLSAPADLLQFPLIHEDSRDTWMAWFQAAGVAVTPPLKGHLFSDHTLVLQNAVRGSGVALADIILARDDIESGRLTCPFDLTLPFGNYWLVARNFEKLSPSARKFAAWLETTLPDFNTPTPAS
ncbi:LysR substrate-binding domain-containing protein [Rhizobium sp. L1K21]|nr:LysR substrate-binding domain-containing protein [Rhizobium sp. L1K21]MCO6185739.1 LysR substrate-binding domain-containing protein [Rhizobium sp. L1K21]